MVALLDDPALGDDGDLVGVLDGGQPVRDDQRGAPAAQLVECLLDQDLGGVVQRGGGLVEDQDRRVLEEDARDGQPLLLAAGQLEFPVANQTFGGRDPASNHYKVLTVSFVAGGKSLTKSFREPGPASLAIPMAAPVRQENVLADLSADWRITSFTGVNAPTAPRTLARLKSWSESDDPKLRYFAGYAVYEKTVEGLKDSKVKSLKGCGAEAKENGIWLDLGAVHDIANVYLNDKFVACLWEPPYRVALPSQLLNPLTFKPFNLKVELVNLLPNRLIGDAIALKNGAKEEVSNVGPWPKWVIENRPDSGTGIFSWTNFRPAWTADDRPISSGLVGPVKLICHTGCAARGEADAVKLPGEPCTAAPIPCAPFPDRLSAYVWRNWNLVPLKRLASVVKACPADLEQVAADLGLEPAGPVLPEWRRKGYITLLRRNWHLLDYDQLTELVDMTRRELAFSLVEEDFLWVKLGRVKPKCGPLVWTAADASDERRASRRRIASVLAEEGLDPSAGEEPRFAFISDLARTEPALPTAKGTSPFDFRLIFSYFADYVDPLGDPEIRSYPEGLLQQLSRQGVNAVWLHAVLRTLAKDPKYPEWGEGSERRIANLKTLVARAAKYGIKVYLYVNEPRGMDEAFFRADPAREAFHGARDSNCDIYALCPSHPEPLRWLSDSLAQVFAEVPGLGGVFTITMSENMTHCKARHSPKPCARCAQRPAGDIIAAVNRAIVEGIRRGNPQARPCSTPGTGPRPRYRRFWRSSRRKAAGS